MPALYPTRKISRFLVNIRRAKVWAEVIVGLLRKIGLSATSALGFLRAEVKITHSQGPAKILLSFSWNPVPVDIHSHGDRVVSQLLLDVSGAVVVHEEDH